METEIDTQQYLELFISESREHLTTLNASLLELEKDPQNRDALDELFRAVHTIKGMSATMGFDTLATLSHKIEDVLDRLRSTEDVTTDTIDILFRCFDSIEELIDSIEKGKGEDLDISNIIDELDNLQSGHAGHAGTDRTNRTNRVPSKKEKEKEAETTGDTDLTDLTDKELNEIYDLAEKGFKHYLVRVDLHKECTLKSVRAFIVFKNLDRHGHVIKTYPSSELIEDEAFELNFDVLLASKDRKKDIEKTVRSIPEIEDVKVTEFELEETKMSKKTKNIKKSAEKEDKKAISHKLPKSRTSKTGKNEGIPGVKPQRSVQSVRVNIERLDSLMNLMGELIINKTRLKQIASDNELDELNEVIAITERLTSDLQEEILQIRMVPIEHVFNRFPRIVRDISREEGKLIDFEIHGGEIELDRTVLDEIADPLVHLIRNSVNHGIETPGEREKKKKPKRGKLKLEAIREKEHVSIIVEDDGKGIDTQKIKEVAVKKGLISDDDAKTMTREDEIDLIFLPGFSTATKITSISGRGVGLDVVKTSIESLGGSIALETEPGKGTKVTLNLPLTLAIVQALLIRLDIDTYAIPITNIVRIVDVNPEDIRTIQNREVINVQDEVISIIKLREYFQICKKIDREDREDTGDAQDTVPIVIVSKGTKKAGIVVDELVGQQEVVIKSLGDYLKGIRGFAGGTILGDGRVALILDVGGII